MQRKHLLLITSPVAIVRYGLKCPPALNTGWGNYRWNRWEEIKVYIERFEKGTGKCSFPVWSVGAERGGGNSLPEGAAGVPEVGGRAVGLLSFCT